MRVLRTPDDQFTALADFDYEPRYADIGGLRMTCVQAGPDDGEPVLLRLEARPGGVLQL